MKQSLNVLHPLLRPMCLPIVMLAIDGGFFSTTVAANPPQPAKSEALPPLPADHSADRRLLKKLGPSFNDFASDHFTIISDSHAGHVAQLSQAAEATLADVVSFARHLGISIHRPASKLRVIFFNDWPEYEQYAGQSGFQVSEVVPGFYDDHTNRCLIFDYANSESLRRRRQELLDAEIESNRANPGDMDAAALQAYKKRQHRAKQIKRQIQAYEQLIIRTVVRHEIAHQVLTNLGLLSRRIGQDRWLREGLAMQFENRQDVNRFRLADFRAIDRRGGRLMLRELVSDPAYIGPGAEDLSGRYALAWALVDYLVHTQPAAFASYLLARSKGAEPASGRSSTIATFEAAFGKLDVSFQQKLRTYMNHSK